MAHINGTVNWGIIGCGDVCEVKSGPAFSKVPNSRLVAVMRRDREKAKDFAQRHAVPMHYGIAAELINDDEVNAIYIATPPSSHEMYVEMALTAGKPVYVEKPVTISSTSLQRMISMEQKYHGKVSVAHYRRALPLFKEVKKLVQNDTLGKIKLILLKTLQPASSKIIANTGGNWRIDPGISGGGLFHDLSPHQLDIMYWLFGAPQEVNVITANQAKQYNAPDLTIVNLKFSNDIHFNGVWNFNVSENATADLCEIIGDNGTLRFSFFRVSTIELITAADAQSIEMNYPANIQEPHINEVVRFFRGEADNPCTLNDALVTMQVMDKAI